MKTIIETNDTDSAAIQFKKSNKLINWKDLSRAEQVKILNAFSSCYDFYSTLIKSE